VSLDGIKLKLVDSIDEAFNMLQWLGERRPLNALAVDLETTGLDRENDRVKLAQIGDGMTGWAVPWEHWNGVIRDIVARWEGGWITHNGPSFDLVFLRRAGVDIPQHLVDDTMVRAAVNEPHMSKGLKQQASRHVDAAAGGLGEVLKGTSWTWENVPVTYAPYWQYGALDPILTYRLEQHHRQVTEATCKDAYDLELATQFVTQRMERYGAHVDRTAARETYERFMKFCTEVESWCIENYGVKPGSNQGVVKILQEAGHTFSKATASGAVALDAEVLEHIEHPLAVQVLARRQLQKLASTYLKFYIERADADDLLHPSINTLGARTGRMSVSEPNMQNLPRQGTSGAADLVRNMITSRYVERTLPDDQWRALTHGSLLMCDFAQIEMRMLAHFSGEAAMIEAFRHPDLDFFVLLARQIYQDETIDKKDKRRQITKNGGYAKVYGAGVRKFAQTAGIPESQARDFMKWFDGLYPGVQRFSNTTLNEAFERQKAEGLAYIRSPFTGRPFVADSRKEYALINYLIQGSAAEILKRKLLELDAAGLGPWMFLPVHDEILLDVPGEHVMDAANTLQRVMNDNTLLTVPIEAEVSYGRRWGSKMDWDLSLAA
jgi:DNA polymerase-1